jgi:hypothetical protein
LTGWVDAAIITQQGHDDLAPLSVLLRVAGGRGTGCAGGPVLTGDGNALPHDEAVSCSPA